MIKTNPNTKPISLKRQPLVLLIFSSISFLLILFRLIFLQLLNYESFKKMSDENRIRLISSFIGWSLGISKNSCNPYFEQNIDQLN